MKHFFQLFVVFYVCVYVAYASIESLLYIVKLDQLHMILTHAIIYRLSIYSFTVYWPTVETRQFVIRPEFPVNLLTFSNFVLFHVRQLG